jgi:membrane-associated phospholipid phosphatase
MDAEVSAAQALGSNAVAAFVGALAALLLMVLVLWLALKRAEPGEACNASLPQRLLIRRAIVTCAILVGAGIVFAEMAGALDAGDAVGRFDVALTQALRLQLSAATLRVFALVTHLGDTRTLTALCIVVAAVLVWCGQRALTLAWVLAVAGNGALNNLLKSVFERVRPEHDHRFLVADGGWSFPSGHSSGSVAAYGMLAYVILRFVSMRWQLPLLLLAAAVAFTTGVSRVFLQVHYASDVLAGFASGLAWLTICMAVAEWWRVRRREAGSARLLS